jgi:predicted  nucleic acid-binding Zn-ribbon protein
LHPHVRKLLELQKVDQESASLTRDLDSLPAEEARRRKRLDELEAVARGWRERVTRTELDVRALERAIRGSDDEIKRLDERLRTVRNNAEYQATLFQIESVRRDRDATQEECLKLLEGIEPQKAELAKTEAAAAGEREVFEGFLAEAAALRRARACAIAEVSARRAALTDGIPPELLQQYEGLFKTRGGMAVCAVEAYYCQGCYNKVTMNDIAKLMGKTSVVVCGSCQRILHLA